MSDDVLVKVEGVSKKFCRSLKRSLWYGVQDVASEMLGREGQHDELRKNEFWAVNDVSFELKRGECLGLIGPNGAGKSTLLKMLNGLVKPDKGRITMRGRVGALIELGAGFNPILTARENIYVNGSVLGFSTKEIDGKFDAIVDFAEIEEFIDTPVQNFSSGMKVRLGFAVAAQMEPDVLIIDEVLAVGDTGFRAKCINSTMESLRTTAVLFVSHQIPDVSRISTTAVVLHNGHVRYQGTSLQSAIGQYLEVVRSPSEHTFQIAGVELVNCTINGSQDGCALMIDQNSALCVEMSFKITKKIPTPTISLVILSAEMLPVAQCSSFLNGIVLSDMADLCAVKVDLGPSRLNPGRYCVEITLAGKNRGKIYLKQRTAVSFTVSGDHAGYAPIQISGRWKQYGF